MNQDRKQAAPQEQRSGQAGHGRHRWLMIACCIPMLAIAIALVATGVVGIGLIFIALACTAMMAMMHKGMSHGDGDESNRQ